MSDTVYRLDSIDDSPSGVFSNVLELVVAEVRAVATGQPSERKVQESRRELGRIAFSMIGPLLMSPQQTWEQEISAVATGRALRTMLKVVGTPAGKAAADREMQAERVRRLHPHPRSHATDLGDDLERRVEALFEAVNNQVQRRHVRLPKQEALDPIFARMLATLSAVVVAGSGAATFAEWNVNRCYEECLAAMHDYGRYFRVPDADREALDESKKFKERLAAIRREDDEFANLGE